MRYKCLIFDHDDTVVNSTAVIHYPAFMEYLRVTRGGSDCTLEEYFIKNFDPGFVPWVRQDFHMSDEELKVEEKFWQDFVADKTPEAYQGIKEIMEQHRAKGGIIGVISHSVKDKILSDYAANGLPEPDIVYGWEEPPEHRKPFTWPVEQIMKKFCLQPEEILMIDDLKPGYDMAAAAGIGFAAAGWSNDIKLIEDFMRTNCGSNYFKTIKELADMLSE